MARTNKQHLERARAKLNEIFEELEQLKPLITARYEKLHAEALQKLEKIRAKLDALKIE